MPPQEEVFFEGKPHIGDLLVNIVVGATLIGLPLFVGSLVRRIWVSYRITDRRVTVFGGWGGKERSDVIYKEIAKVVTVPRGLGAWGDMVLTLKDGSRLELRSMPNFRDVYAYVQERIDAQAQQASGALGSKQAAKTVKRSVVIEAQAVKVDPESDSPLDTSEAFAKEPPEVVTETPSFGFTPAAERLNGRIAMLGFVIWLLIEALTGQPLLSALGIG